MSGLSSVGGPRFVPQQPVAPDEAAPSAPAPETTAPAEATVERGRSPSGVEKLLRRGARQVGRAVRREVGREARRTHDADTSFDIVDGFQGHVRVKEEVLLPTDPAVQKDPLKRATNAALTEDGSSIVRARVHGELEASGAFGGASGEGVGFPAGARLGYTLTKPLKYADEEGVEPLKTAGRLLKDQTLDLPVSSSKARELPPGSEVRVEGEIHGGARAESGELRASADQKRHATIDVKRLAGEQVAITVTTGALTQGQAGVDRALGESASATASLTGQRGTERFVLDLSKPQALPTYRALLRGDVDTAKAVAAGGAGSGVTPGGTVDRAWTARKLAAGLATNLTNGFGAGFSAKGLVSYDAIYPGQPGAARAAIRPDTREAERAVAAGGAGVTRAGTLTEEIESKTKDGEVQLFKAKLFESKAARRDRVARLVNADGATVIRESEFTHSRRTLLQRGSVQWEALQVSDPASGESERFLHMKVGDLKDKWTSHDEVMRVDRFASAMGAEVTERRIDTDVSWWDRVNPRAYGSTELNADVYFTEDAITRLGGASREDALQAFGRATAALAGAGDVPGWASADPAVAKEARRILESWDPVEGPDDLDSESADYYRLTGGRSIDRDHSTFRRGKEFATFVGRMGDADETEGLRAFADLGERRDFDFYASVAAINDLAGDEVVLLNRLEMTGGDTAIRVSSEGALAHPDTKISEAFKD